MDFILSKIISRPPRNGHNHCDIVAIDTFDTASELLDTHQVDNGFCDNAQLSSDIDTNKSSAPVSGTVKGPLTLDSDISGIETDNTVSPDFDRTLDTSYQIQNPNATFGDLLNGLDNLQLNTPQRLPKPNNQDANNSLSSDEEMFQECESGFDLDATTVNSINPSSIQAHSSNIDHNVFDKTINFSSITTNSAASLATSTIDMSQQSEKNDTLFKSTVCDQTETNESIINTQFDLNALSNAVERATDVPSTEHSMKFQEETVAVVEEPAPIEIVITQDVESKAEPCEPDHLDVTLNVSSVDTVANPEDQIFEEKSSDSPVNVTQDIEITTQSPNTNQSIVDEQIVESVDVNKTLNLNETTENVNSTSVDRDGESLAETSTSSQNPEDNGNTTIGSEALENDVQTSIDNSQTLQSAEPAKEEVPLNVTTDLSSNGAETCVTEAPIQSIDSKLFVSEMKPTESIQEEEVPIPQFTAANQTFEAMDVDMNETVDLQQPSTDLTVNQLPVQEPHLNQTVEMADIDEADEMSKPALNVTINVPAQTNDPQSTAIENAMPSDLPEMCERKNQKMLNVTQDLADEPKTTVELNQTIDITNSKEPVTSPVQMNNINETFATNDSISVFDRTHNLSKDFLSSTRRSIDTRAKTPVSQSTFNPNETIVVDNKLPSINTSFIVSPKPTETQPEQMNLMEAKNQNQNMFKLPAIPSTASNPFDMKPNSDGFEVSDDEFQSPGLILNPNDFDFLLSRGCNSNQINPRDSILERFDPFSGRKSIVSTALINRTEAPLIAAPPSVSTILEVDSINESSPVCANDQLISIKKSPVNKLNALINERGDNKQIVKLDASEKTELSIIGEGDNSQASSTTETYETASIGESQKADVTMSVGLIHDLKMDNMKSLEQDKVEPNLKMNDEHKVKQEMVGDVERKLKEAEAREEALLRRITEKEKALNKMSAVVENYEKTMVEMISEREQITQNYEKQLMQLKTERDANSHHLASLENTFSDLHIKYEKSKQMAVEVKESEAKLVEKLEFCQQQMKLQEQRYDKLKNHALSQLEGANSKLESLSKAHSNEMKKITAQLKKEEISRQSIMEQLAQKTKENEELVKICDELINNGADGS